MDAPAWELHEGNGPVIATAVHNGHDLRAEVNALIALDDAQQLREEDPIPEDGPRSVTPASSWPGRGSRST